MNIFRAQQRISFENYVEIENNNAYSYFIRIDYFKGDFRKLKKKLKITITAQK